MASLGHIVVGMAAARVQSRDAIRARPALAAMLFWAALSFLPVAIWLLMGWGALREQMLPAVRAG